MPYTPRITVRIQAETDEAFTAAIDTIFAVDRSEPAVWKIDAVQATSDGAPWHRHWSEHIVAMLHG